MQFAITPLRPLPYARKPQKGKQNKLKPNALAPAGVSALSSSVSVLGATNRCASLNPGT